MKKQFILDFVNTMILISTLLLSSCQKQDADDVLSKVGSSEITSSDSASSEPEKDESSKIEESSKPEETSKPEISSKPKPTTSSKPAPTPSQTTSKVTSQVKPDAERIVGKWEATIDISKSLADQGFDMPSPANVKTFYEFTQSKTAIVTIDEASYRNMATPLLEQSLRNVVSQQYGMTLEDFAAQNSTTIQALIDASMEESVKNLTQTGTYKMEGKKLTITLNTTGEADTYTYSFINDNKLTLSSDGESETFTRVK